MVVITYILQGFTVLLIVASFGLMGLSIAKRRWLLLLGQGNHRANLCGAFRAAERDARDSAQHGSS